MSDPTTPDTLTAAAERARHLPEGGLTAYANRMRESHQRLANGWCSCDNPLCPARYLLDHIDTLVQSYNLKVQDLAQETARNAAASAPAVDREALESLVAEAIDCATPIGRPASPDDLDAQTTAVLDVLTAAGYVTTRARVAERALTVEQIETAARELHRRDLGDVNAWMVESEHRRDIWRSKARTVAKAFGLSVAEPAVEADHAG